MHLLLALLFQAMDLLLQHVDLGAQSLPLLLLLVLQLVDGAVLGADPDFLVADGGLVDVDCRREPS